MQKHTAELWEVGNTGNHQGLIYAEKTGDNIAVAYDKKNAKLIAAAPDMLKALKQCEEVLFQYVHGNETPEMCAMAETERDALEAIQKATD